MRAVKLKNLEGLCHIMRSSKVNSTKHLPMHDSAKKENSDVIYVNFIGRFGPKLLGALKSLLPSIISFAEFQGIII